MTASGSRSSNSRNSLAIAADQGLPGAESLCAWLVEPLDDHGHALAAADAHGFQADGLVPGDQVVEQGGGDPGAGHAERVAQRDGAAVHVEPVDVDAELAVGG